MAENAAGPAVTPGNLFATLAGNAELQNRRLALIQRTMNVPQQEIPTVELSAEDFDFNSLTALILTDVNGSSVLPAQRVRVEYLAAEKKLKIPYALGMGYADGANARCRTHPVLIVSYNKLITQSYVQLRKLMTDSDGFTSCAAEIDKLAPATGAALTRKLDWDSNNWCRLEDGTLDSVQNVTAMFAYISMAIKSNCDIRDYFKLNDAGMSVGDADWKGAKEVPKERLAVKLKPYTLQTVAAMNLEPCNNQAQAAWARAYGLAIGLLPSTDTVSVSELSWISLMPAAAHRRKVAKDEAEAKVELYPFSLNLIAMFGLMHLNKDHTFRMGDAALTRVNESYLKALRTMVPGADMALYQDHKEEYCRTLAHPFGLGQTYWLAQVMGHHGCLAAPLAIRVDVCPPPVQRQLIVLAARDEWSGMPAGMELTTMFHTPLGHIETQVAAIRQCAPAYSHLHAQYGIAELAVVDPQVRPAVMAIMPCAYGYAHSQHINDNNEKDGLALALSFENVARDQRSLVTSWQVMWTKYVDDSSKAGLLDFARSAMESYESARGA